MMTDFLQSQSPCIYRLALLDPGAATILTVRTDGELGLPQVAVPRTVRTVEFIQRRIAERWGAAAVVLDLPGPGEDEARWVLAELRSSPASLASTMLSLKKIPDAVISARECTVFRNLLSAPSLDHSSDPLHPLHPLNLIRLTLESLLWLVRVEIVMATGGIRAIHRLVGSFRTRKRANAGRPNIESLQRAMNIARGLYPKRVLCLQGSAAVLLLLRNHGWNVQLVLGAQIVPFRSHAWVELEGAVVNDTPHMREIYQVFERL